MMFASTIAADRRAARRRVPPSTTAMILILWTIYIVSLTLERLLRYPEQGLDYLAPRTVATAAGVLITYGIAILHTRAAHWTVPERVALALSAALMGCALHSLINLLIFAYGFGLTEPFEFTDFMMASFSWMWFYLALSLIILALCYNAEIADSERRLATMAAKAHTAQIRALRYQLNPHFLFNTLNSIAALVRRQEDTTAGTMIENLSDFLRTGLALDPHDDIPLERELELQGLYLDIERQRFPDRLAVAIEVPHALREAMVPALITQPLVENAIKYAVARSSIPVLIRIEAHPRSGMLLLRVSDNGGDAAPPAESGTRLGLGNVEGRLRARFGSNCAFEAGPQASGGFAVSIALPLSAGAAR